MEAPAAYIVTSNDGLPVVVATVDLLERVSRIHRAVPNPL
jgi:hypothetical protein